MKTINNSITEYLDQAEVLQRGRRRSLSCRSVLTAARRFTLVSHHLKQRVSSSAERVTSLGQDWHRPCLKCDRCKKTLSPGSHSEHEGKPYCTKPCYQSLFGPKGYGTVASSHVYR
ncbi:hypothetical protein CRM22_010196 [Opisthorchis felineus]|uniref:LIM zinc-binding domain-containing protein n=1 Tax=Opisthorchis felineus TaxID=147828 RepID=A0A4S2L0E7_OPIFE|nr:hypothetical protein CRM22_010196 [Opisthorchis felineus]